MGVLREGHKRWWIDTWEGNQKTKKDDDDVPCQQREIEDEDEDQRLMGSWVFF